MATLRESAKEYEPKQTKNIADLDKVSTELDLVEKKFKEGTPDEFSVKVVAIDGEEYRVPESVIAQLKDQLEERPDAVSFKVKKTGEGMQTKYTVVLLD